MTSSNKKTKTIFKRKPSIWLIFVSILVASTFWYFITQFDKLETQLEIKVDYYGIPRDLAIMDGLVDKIIVRVSAPAALIRALPRDSNIRAINLSDLKIGENIIPITEIIWKELGPITSSVGSQFRYRRFHVLDMSPSTLKITTDRMAERKVRLEAQPDKSHGDAIIPDKITLLPGNVTIRGPESLISRINSLPVAFNPDLNKIGETITKDIAINTDNLITAMPATVKLSYEIPNNMKKLQLTRKIIIAADQKEQYEVIPKEINLNVEVPENLADNEAFLNDLKITVLPPPLQKNERKEIKARLQVPQGMKVLNPKDEMVVITKITDDEDDLLNTQTYEQPK